MMSTQTLPPAEKKVLPSGPKIPLCTKHHLRRNTTGCILLLYLMNLQIASTVCLYRGGISTRVRELTRKRLPGRESRKINVVQVHLDLCWK